MKLLHSKDDSGCHTLDLCVILLSRTQRARCECYGSLHFLLINMANDGTNSIRTLIHRQLDLLMWIISVRISALATDLFAYSNAWFCSLPQCHFSFTCNSLYNGWSSADMFLINLPYKLTIPIKLFSSVTSLALGTLTMASFLKPIFSDIFCNSLLKL